MSTGILLTLLLTCSAVVATIHQDRRQAFRSAAERLPEELEDRIWEFYPKVTYGENPNSPILALEETQALFPPLHFDWRFKDSVWYKSDRLNQTMTKDRYLTLYVTAESTERNVRDDLNLSFERDCNCPLEIRYFVANERVHQWSGESPYSAIHDAYCGNTGKIFDFSISKPELNRALEPGTEILLYIPQGCTLTLVNLYRIIGRQHFNSQAEDIFPANISWSTQLPVVGLIPPQEKRSIISIIIEWIKQL